MNRFFSLFVLLIATFAHGSSPGSFWESGWSIGFSEESCTLSRKYVMPPSLDADHSSFLAGTDYNGAEVWFLSQERWDNARTDEELASVVVVAGAW